MSVEALGPDALYRRCDPATLPFETTAELGDVGELEDIVGQARAMEALRFGVAIRREGYNLFAAGPGGVGRRSVALRVLRARARHEAAAPDWCYVHALDDALHPKALRLPPGRGEGLRRDMAALLDTLKDELPAVFESRAYQDERAGIEEETKRHQQQAFQAVEREASSRGLALVQTPVGVGITPAKDGEALAPEEIEKLDDPARERYETAAREIRDRLREAMRDAEGEARNRRNRLRDLDRRYARRVIDEPLGRLKDRHRETEAVVGWLDAVEADLLDRLPIFLKAVTPEDGDDGQAALAAITGASEPAVLRRYQVNVLVHNDPDGGAPVVEEARPLVQNLVGRTEYRAQLGALTTDVGLIRAGALHRANGGYLVLDAHKVLLYPYAWEELKRALLARELKIGSVNELASPVSTVSLEPEPIPLDVKVVLVGERHLYAVLAALDPDFPKLFKVVADFEGEMARTDENAGRYARLVARMGRTEDILPFGRDGIARLVEAGSRLAGDGERLSAHLQLVGDLVRESDHFARESSREAVGAGDVEAALEAQRRRLGRVRDRLEDEMLRGTLLVDTVGEIVGQANGLSVMQMGPLAFGRPSRITARVRLGRGKVVDIERETDLGGPIHSKGVLILGGYLGGRYVPDRPLALQATLVLEQSYGGVEGDSASAAELVTLLSAVAEVPLRQDLAMTGSVNQRGEVQAVGGINEKIEAFFELCRARGLTGSQGVVVPAANRPHLMLRREVVEAVAAGRFQVWPVRHVDEAIALLTGLEAGDRDERGRFPEKSFNGRVEHRLSELADRARAFKGDGT